MQLPSRVEPPSSPRRMPLDQFEDAPSVPGLLRLFVMMDIDICQAFSASVDVMMRCFLWWVTWSFSWPQEEPDWVMMYYSF